MIKFTLAVIAATATASIEKFNETMMPTIEEEDYDFNGKVWEEREVDDAGVVTIRLMFEFTVQKNEEKFEGDHMVQGYAQWDSSLIEGRFDGITCTNIWKRNTE